MLQKVFKSQIPGWVRLACLLLLLVHLSLLGFDTFQRSADGWIHLFFASHWQLNWWQDWEPRWYLGFSVFFYPPLAHQLLAGFTLLLGWKLGYILLQMLALLGVGLGIYRYARIFVCQRVSAWVVLGTYSLSALAIGVHVFGLLTHYVALACLLNGLASLHDGLERTSRDRVFLGLALLLCVCLSNLFTAVLGMPLWALPVLLQQRRRWQQILVLVPYWLPLVVLALLPLIYYRWHYHVVTAPIYHSSQHNILGLHLFNYFMFYGLYGVLLIIIPIWCVWGVPRRHLWPLWPSLFLLFVLSLGGSTPIARGLLGPLFDALALDRFGHWASLMFLIPLLDMLQNMNGRCWRWPGIVLLSLHLVFFVISCTAIFWRPLPALRDVSGVQHYLAQPERQAYRYLTLGLQRPNFGRLSAGLANRCLDGYLPFVRNMPVLNDSGLPGLDSLRPDFALDQQILGYFLAAADTYALRYIVLPDASAWRSHLAVWGWRPDFSHNGLEVWQSTAPIQPLPLDDLPVSPWPLRLIWGVMPLAGLGFVLLMILFRWPGKAA